MKKQYSTSREDASQKPLGVWDDELEILSEQLNPEEMYVLGYLKGFNRNTLKEWGKKGLMDFAVNTS